MGNDNKKYLDEYYDKLTAHKLETQKEYQKVILGLSGGALTVSLTFSSSIVSESGVLFNIVLVAGWCLLLTTVLLQVYYYRKVTLSTDELIKKIEDIQSKDEEDLTEINNIYSKSIIELQFINKISIISMFSGFTLISIFFSINLLLKNPSNKSGDNCGCERIEKHEVPNDSRIEIENNPVFIIDNGNIDTTIIKKNYWCKPKNPCE